MIPRKSKQKKSSDPSPSFGVEESVLHTTADGKFVNLQTGDVIDKMPPRNQETWLKTTLKA
jgi:hypothetical protein